MSGWDSRIQIRIDDAEAYEGSPAARLDRGEMAAALTTNGVQIRVGSENDQRFSDSPVLLAGAAGFAPLVIDEGATTSGAGMLYWDGTQWQPDATPIAWNTSAASGAVIYTDSTDEWSTDTALTVIADADGGTFTGSFVAPSFSESYDPTIGEP
jgi:hypothetical protein